MYHDKVTILIDGNSVGHTANSHKERYLGKQEVQGIFNFMAYLVDIKRNYPDSQMIVLWDGESWRKQYYPDYKKNRVNETALRDPKREIERLKKNAKRKMYHDQVKTIRKILTHLGIRQVIASNYEADDLAAYLCKAYRIKGKKDGVIYPVRLITSDQDWLQLVKPNVTWKSNRSPFTFVNAMNFQEKVGFQDPRIYLQSKLLMGDKGDNVPGYGGFGEKTVKKFFDTYPDLDYFWGAEFAEIEDMWVKAHGKLPECVRKLHAEQNIGGLELQRILMDLNAPEIPKPVDLKITNGDLDKNALVQIFREHDFNELLSDIDGFINTVTHGEKNGHTSSRTGKT